MKFNLIENPRTFYEDFYEDFKNDFLNSQYNISDLRKKYNLSFHQYNKLRKLVCEETGLKSKPTKNFRQKKVIEDNTYIRQIYGKWGILKVINKKVIYYGYYDDINVARYIRDRLIECNWDKSYLHEIQNDAKKIF